MEAMRKEIARLNEIIGKGCMIDKAQINGKKEEQKGATIQARKASLNQEWAWTHKRSQNKWKEDSDGYECVQFERKGRIGIDQPTQPITPQVFGFHICTTFHEHEHHASIRELISHET